MRLIPSCSSIGKKAVVTVTGLILVGFVIGHMLGNLQIYLGPAAINSYALKLRHLGPLLWGVRFFLLLALVLHIVFSIKVARENRAARPIHYTKEDTLQATFASRSMMPTGILLFAFIVYHLLHFTWRVTNPGLSHLLDAQGRHDVYSMMVLSFANPLISSVYILAMGPLAFHLGHGASSWCQSLGLANDKNAPCLKALGLALSVILFVGYVSIPVSVLLAWVRLP